MNRRASPGRSATFGAAAAAAPRARSRFYVGRRSETAEVYVVTSRDVERLRPRAHPAEAVFDWASDAGPGGVELAFAILRDTMRRKPPEPVCARFEAEVIASLPRAGFVFGRDDVASWLATQSRGTIYPRTAGAALRILSSLRSAARSRFLV